MTKLKFYKTLRLVLILAIIVVTFFVVKKFYKSYKTENKAKDVIAEIKTNLEDQEPSSEKIVAELGGYKVIGIIKIPKIDLEY